MKFYIVDVFAEAKYQGNQLAVFIPDRPLSDEEMQKIAAEINFSETTFILSGKQENGGYDVRIFTPDIEVPFAGHPTLGTAFIIDKYIEKNTTGTGHIILNCKVGPIPVSIEDGVLTMEQNPPQWQDYHVDAQTVADIFNLDISDIDSNNPIESVSTGLPCLIIPVTSVDAIKNFTVNKILYKAHYDAGYGDNLLLFARNSIGQTFTLANGICLGHDLQTQIQPVRQFPLWRQLGVGFQIS